MQSIRIARHVCHGSVIVPGYRPVRQQCLSCPPHWGPRPCGVALGAGFAKPHQSFLETSIMPLTRPGSFRWDLPVLAQDHPENSQGSNTASTTASEPETSGNAGDFPEILTPDQLYTPIVIGAPLFKTKDIQALIQERERREAESARLKDPERLTLMETIQRDLKAQPTLQEDVQALRRQLNEHKLVRGLVGAGASVQASGVWAWQKGREGLQTLARAGSRVRERLWVRIGGVELFGPRGILFRLTGTRFQGMERWIGGQATRTGLGRGTGLDGTGSSGLKQDTGVVAPRFSQWLANYDPVLQYFASRADPHQAITQLTGTYQAPWGPMDHQFFLTDPTATKSALTQDQSLLDPHRQVEEESWSLNQQRLSRKRATELGGGAHLRPVSSFSPEEIYNRVQSLGNRLAQQISVQRPDGATLRMLSDARGSWWASPFAQRSLTWATAILELASRLSRPLHQVFSYWFSRTGLGKIRDSQQKISTLEPWYDHKAFIRFLLGRYLPTVLHATIAGDLEQLEPLVSPAVLAQLETAQLEILQRSHTRTIRILELTNLRIVEINPGGAETDTETNLPTVTVSFSVLQNSVVTAQDGTVAHGGPSSLQYVDYMWFLSPAQPRVTLEQVLNDDTIPASDLLYRWRVDGIYAIEIRDALW